MSMQAEISFPGIFADQLPKQCFLSFNDSVVMSTMWGSSESIIVVNLTAKSIERITGVLPIASSADISSDSSSGSSGNGSSSVGILDVSGDNILLVTSSPTTPQQLCVYNCRDKRVIAQNSKPSKFFPTRMKPSPPPGEESLHREPPSNIADLRARHFHHQTDGIPFDSMLLYPNLKRLLISTTTTPSGKPSFLPIPRKRASLAGATTPVFGVGVDRRSESRCDHWHSELDIVAIKFLCCGKFYACRSCHDEVRVTHTPPTHYMRDYLHNLRLLVYIVCVYLYIPHVCSV